MKYRAGDIVHVRAKVSPGGQFLYLLDEEGCESIIPHVVSDECQIVHVEPKPIQTGDVVRTTDTAPHMIYTVICIDDNVAWIKSHKNPRDKMTKRLDSLVVCDPDKEK